MTTPQQTTFTDAITSWDGSLVQQGQDASGLAAILAAIKGEPADAAFVAVSLALAEGGSQVQGDKVTIDASLMDVGSAGSGLVTEATTDVSNMGSTPGDTGDATDMLGAVGFLQSTMQGQLNLIQTEGPQGAGVWVDGSTATSIVNACNGIDALFGGSASAPPSAATVASDISTWTTQGSATAPNGQTGMQNIQALNGFVSTLNNAFNGYSQMQNNALQFQNNQVGQIVTSSRALLQAIVNMTRGVVGNLKSG